MIDPPVQDKFAVRRAAMVQKQLRERGIRDVRVLAAMAEVPRHFFVLPAKSEQAYEDQPLEIGSGQTISQPYIVAAMLESLQLNGTERVLEIGTGSGYQTALLARLTAQVFTMERYRELLERAKLLLNSLGMGNIVFEIGDGSLGLPGKAPFNAIVVSAGAPGVPEPLLQQLAEGGRMIIPVGAADSQTLQLVHRINGRLEYQTLDGCRFVPLIGKEGFAQ